MVAEAYGFQPSRVALCTCGWVAKGTLAEVNTRAEQHVANGCEGCDHAYRIENVGGQR